MARAGTAERSRARSLRTVGRIASAARELVVEHNGEAFTTQELVERSGCALQTIYRYFPSKATLLLAVFEQAINEGTAHMAAEAGAIADPVARLRRVIELSIPDTSPGGTPFHPRLLVSLHTQLLLLVPDEVEDAQAPYVHLVRSCIDAMVETGRVAPRADADADARCVMYLVRTAYQTAVFTGIEHRRRLARHVSEFCLAALGVDPATATVVAPAPTAQRPATRRAARRTNTG